jgi:hypothetical protein
VHLHLKYNYRITHSNKASQIQPQFTSQYSGSTALVCGESSSSECLVPTCKLPSGHADDSPTGQSIDLPVDLLKEATYSHSDHLNVTARSQSVHLNVVNKLVVETNLLGITATFDSLHLSEDLVRFAVSQPYFRPNPLTHFGSCRADNNNYIRLNEYPASQENFLVRTLHNLYTEQSEHEFPGFSGTSVQTAKLEAVRAMIVTRYHSVDFAGYIAIVAANYILRPVNAVVAEFFPFFLDRVCTGTDNVTEHGVFYISNTSKVLRNTCRAQKSISGLFIPHLS